LGASRGNAATSTSDMAITQRRECAWQGEGAISE
jgi:hypothetical protein